jgi:hypothetical protein
MIKKRPRSLLIGAASLLVIGGVATYWGLTQRNSAVPTGANLIPQEALMSLTVSTNQNQWQKLREFGTPETRLALEQGLADFQKRFLTRNGYSYKNDIQPWVGDEVTVAFLPSAVSPAPPDQQSIVWILPIENLDRARRTFADPKRSAAQKLAERTYKGIRIQETQGLSSQKYSATVLDGRFFVATTLPKAIDQVIDAYQGGTSLVTLPGYRAALSEINNNQPFAQVYVNLPAAASKTVTGSNKPASSGALGKLEEYQGLGSTIILEPNGVQFNSISWLKPDSQKKLQVDNSAQDMPERLPANTLAMASGGNFKQVWQEYTQGAQSQLAIPFDPDQFRANVQSATGMNFDQDFVNWMDGEFSLALLPAQGETLKGAGLALMFETSDRQAAENTLKRLDEVMGRKFKLNVSQSNVGNQTLTTWKVPPGLPVASHGWLDNDVVFLTLGAPVESAIAPQPKTELVEADLFQTTTRSNLNPNNGHFFVDVTQTLTLLDSSPLLPKLSPRVRKFANAIQAIGVTAAVNNERSTRYDIFVELKKVGQP